MNPEIRQEGGARLALRQLGGRQISQSHKTRYGLKACKFRLSSDMRVPSLCKINDKINCIIILKTTFVPVNRTSPFSKFSFTMTGRTWYKGVTLSVTERKL